MKTKLNPFLEAQDKLSASLICGELIEILHHADYRSSYRNMKSGMSNTLEVGEFPVMTLYVLPNYVSKTSKTDELTFEELVLEFMSEGISFSAEKNRSPRWRHVPTHKMCCEALKIIMNRDVSLNLKYAQAKAALALGRGKGNDTTYRKMQERDLFLPMARFLYDRCGSTPLVVNPRTLKRELILTRESPYGSVRHKCVQFCGLINKKDERKRYGFFYKVFANKRPNLNNAYNIKTQHISTRLLPQMDLLRIRFCRTEKKLITSFADNSIVGAEQLELTSHDWAEFIPDKISAKLSIMPDQMHEFEKEAKDLKLVGRDVDKNAETIDFLFDNISPGKDVRLKIVTEYYLSSYVRRFPVKIANNITFGNGNVEFRLEDPDLSDLNFSDYLSGNIGAPGDNVVIRPHFEKTLFGNLGELRWAWEAGKNNIILPGSGIEFNWLLKDDIDSGDF